MSLGVLSQIFNPGYRQFPIGRQATWVARAGSCASNRLEASHYNRFEICALLGAGLAISQLLCPPLLAQSSADAPPAIRSNRRAAIPPPFILAPLLGKSPVTFFRELLAVDLAERTQMLTNRSPESQKLILAKVREYESLKPDQRELRLQVTELRWYLWPLMNMSPTNRIGRLDKIPSNLRPLVEDRLGAWDKLSVGLQKDLLENEATIRYFTEIQAGRGSPEISPARSQKLQEGIRQWQEQSEEQRQKLLERFDRFFGLTAQEKQKALNTLSEPEQRQIEKTLRSFEKLNPIKRAMCIRSFEKFANLSLDERQQFLKNAERWKLMTPDERQAWKELVERVPFLPPSLDLHPRPSPPMPGSHPSPRIVTNGR
jgi:hypothetical protein